MTTPAPTPDPGLTLLARGRDTDVYALDDTRVLRRFRDPHHGDTELEARVMAHAAAHGYPVPHVHDLTATDLVLDRLHGPTLMQAWQRRPWRIEHHAAILADLHNRLAAVPAPPWLRTSADVDGDADVDGATTDAAAPDARLLHLDLHPLNVILTVEHGPVVIDWTNAAAGDPGYELARTLVTIATAQAPGLPSRTARRLYLRALRRHTDADPRPHTANAARGKLADPNISPAEAARLRTILRRADKPAP
jgi:aminoglycoside phosphotransferase (APT) family kinase protein